MKKLLKFFYVVVLAGLAAGLFSCNFSVPSEDEPEKASYTVTFNANDGSTKPETATQTFTEGTAQKLKSIAELGFKREGCNFSGWAKKADAAVADYKDGASYTASSDITLYAVWTEEIVEIIYTVEHYQQNINDDGYSRVAADTQTLSGRSGEKTKAEAKNYPGFTAKAFEQKTLSRDYSANIIIYYDRNITKLTLNANGGQFTGGESEYLLNGKFGSEIQIRMGEAAWPSKAGYIFRGWAYSSDAAAADYPQELSFKVTTSASETLTLYAVWESEANLGSSSLAFSDSGNDIEIVADGNIYEVKTTVPGTIGAFSYEWYLNDVKQDCTESSIDLSQLAAGYYILTVKVTNTATGFVYVSTFENPIVF